MLFYSGNTPTPEAEFLAPQREFQELLRSKNFRGALSFRDIRLNCYDDNSYLLTHQPLRNKEHVGYTPLRFLGVRSKKVRRFAKGVGAVLGPSVEHRETGALLSYEVQFRVSRILNVGARALTGSWAPDVWLRVDYVLNRDGNCVIVFSGSQIPSSVHYATGQDGSRRRVYYHDMETNDLTSVRNLIMPSKTGRATEMYSQSVVEQGWIVDD
jgi:hypothetical protein